LVDFGNGLPLMVIELKKAGGVPARAEFDETLPHNPQGEALA
jgi:hypothetical protein